MIDYSPAMVEEVREAREQGCTAREIAAYYNVPMKTLRDWGERDPEFARALRVRPFKSLPLRTLKAESPEFNHFEEKRRVLELLKADHTVSHAAEAVGYSRRALYAWRQADPFFAMAMAREIKLARNRRRKVSTFGPRRKWVEPDAAEDIPGPSEKSFYRVGLYRRGKRADAFNGEPQLDLRLFFWRRSDNKPQVTRKGVPMTLPTALKIADAIKRMVEAASKPAPEPD